MLNAIIRFSLNNRLLVLLAAGLLIVFGYRSARDLPVDVLPDITRPRVVIITECPGLAAEEVEALVTIPLETALNGANGAEAIRSSSDLGLSVIQVEFGWNQDVYLARQIVQERLSVVSRQLPAGIQPTLAPLSSLLGQIMLIGLWSENGTTGAMDLRTLADWTVRNRLMQIPGVAQVIVMGGGKQQFQVLVDPHQLHRYEVSIGEVEQALAASNRNVAGGYIEDGTREIPVRGIGRVRNPDDIRQIVVKRQPNRSILVQDVARVVTAPRFRRGDSSVNGQPAVVLTVQKQPRADTRALTVRINDALQDLRRTLPAGVRLETTYEQRQFIDYSVGNVYQAIRDGAILVVIVLFLFLLNIRTTLITLTAIPLSLLATFLVFRWFGFSINVMTLGGIAVALGELVDDAIVDVENIFRRLRENRARDESARQPVLQVIFQASSEVRKAILNSTIIVILVFVPLFALAGIEGRLFAPLGVAYIVSILASTLVSLTITPVLSWYLLPRSRSVQRDGQSWVLGGCQAVARPVVRASMTRTGFFTAVAAMLILVTAAGVVVWQIGKDFLPPFDEGASQVNLFLPAGASLTSSRRVSQMAEQRLSGLLQSADNPDGPVVWFTSKSGRAEEDEHVMGVNATEITLSLNPDHPLNHDDMVDLLTDTVGDIPGVTVEIEQPIAHLISHMLSGVSAEIGIKLFGDDLGTLQRKAAEIVNVLSVIPGLTRPVAEQQQMIPQLRVEMKRDQLARHGLTADYVNGIIETAMRGQVVSSVLLDGRTFDLIVRYDEPYRSDIDNLMRMPVEAPDGTRIPLSEVAEVYMAPGPNTTKRENSRRRIIVRVNTNNRDLVSAVREIESRLDRELGLPPGYYTELGGEYQAQQSATRQILILGLVALAGVFVVLFAAFQSTSYVLQILIALPAGFIGGTAALLISDQTLSIAATVGFISLGGIAIRNGILLIEAFNRRLDECGPQPDPAARRAAIVQGSLDRLAPVMMTTLTTGCALIPLVIGGNEPGKEILYPVATVILGGLVTSALAEYGLRPGLFYFLSRRQPLPPSPEVAIPAPPNDR